MDGAIEVLLVLAMNRTGVLCVVDEDAVGAFDSAATDEPFGKRVRLKRARRGLDHVPGRTIDDVAGDLSSGVLSPKDVPINVGVEPPLV